ncbi:hypothetical protein FHR70_000725 [Microvirga lupini]|uniref:Uncharacterized protein n=1 Tax=Microvirga lupini TaxID=420324 RepID=A0A7W4VJ25_9HYPH|nr:hypothetical protein [Microvirga lupini]MBB3017685.1 hypothetical protein [Microvirga lupini]
MVIAQDLSGIVFLWKYQDIEFEGNGWRHRTNMGLCDFEYEIGQHETCTDHATAIVTREQWQAERDRLIASGEELPTHRIVGDANDAEGALAGAQAEADTWEQRAVKEATRVVELEAERADLVAALEAIITISDRKHDAWDHAKALIARVKGGAQ